MAIEPLNPATRGQRDSERKRIPMSVPVQKLQVPDLPGFHLHWFNDTPDRIARAIDGGYEFVDPKEIRPNSVGLGTDSAASGNTDLGSRVSVVGGGADSQGRAIRLVLMKIRQEWYDEDQKILEQRNDAVADALMGGRITQGGQGGQAADSRDINMRYVGSRTKIPELFTKGAMEKRLKR